MRSPYAHVEKVRDGVYRVRVEVGRDPLTGRRLRPQETIEAANEREAHAYAPILAAKAGKPLAGASVTYRTYIEALWLSDVDVRQNTRDDYDRFLRLHILPYFGDVKLSDIKPYTVRQWFSWLARNGRTPSVIAHSFRVFRASMNDALRPYELLDRSPTDSIEAPDVPDRELVTLSPDEGMAYLELFAGHRYELAVVLALTCGMRRSEIAALDRQSLRGGVIEIRRGLHTSKGGGTHFEPPKSKRSRRDVIPPAFVVEKWPKGFGPLFPDKAGGYTSPDVIQRAYWRHIHPTRDGKRVALLRYLPLRDLRHSAATLLLSLSFSMDEVADILGHEDVRTTRQFYDRGKRSASTRAAAKMHELFGGQ